MSFITAGDVSGLGFGPVYSRPGKDGRIVATGTTIQEDVAGRSASKFAGLGVLVEDNDDIGINPMPGNSVMRDNLRGMGQIRRFARVPKWGAAEADLDFRPMSIERVSLSGFVDSAKTVAKLYGLYIGAGAGAAVALALVLRAVRKKR